jgi:hypothetical protein
MFGYHVNGGHTCTVLSYMLDLDILDMNGVMRVALQNFPF